MVLLSLTKTNVLLCVSPCFTMFYHVLPCFTMFYHVPRDPPTARPTEHCSHPFRPGGHGSQQPNFNDREKDGFDEVPLPAQLVQRHIVFLKNTTGFIFLIEPLEVFLKIYKNVPLKTFGVQPFM